MPSAGDNPVILDTSVFSLFLKRSDNRAGLYLPDIQGKVLAVTFVTVGELYRWAYARNWGAARIRDLEGRLRRVVVLAAHEGVAQQWARIQSVPGRTMPVNDAWVAACALAYGCVLLAHDAHFADVPGLTVISHLP